MPIEQQQTRLRAQIEKYIDAGHGCCALRQPKMALTMQEALVKHDGSQYDLIAWCIMPNHVHVLIKPMTDLSKIVQSWKSYTGRWAMRHNAELELGVPGKHFWMRDYWDRYMRNEHHYRATIDYIHHNPVKAGLCDHPAQWCWSSAKLLTGKWSVKSNG